MMQALSLEYIINLGLARLYKDPQVTVSPSHKEINTIAYLNVIYLNVMYLNVVKVIAKKHENDNVVRECRVSHSLGSEPQRIGYPVRACWRCAGS